MKLYDFITHKEIEVIANSIKNKIDFMAIERKVKAYEFRIRSSRAGTDFKDGTKEGDYIIAIGFEAINRGNGRPISGERLKVLGDADKLTKYLDNYMKGNKIEGYEGIDEGQMNLFNMNI